VDDRQRQILTVVMDHIIPEDDFPSASKAGVPNYIDGILAREMASFRPTLVEGLAKLDASAREKFGKGYLEIDAGQQVALLVDIECSYFFQHLVRITSEGFYADPGNGGNLNSISWQMIGYKADPK
jgi:hypothetical protein